MKILSLFIILFSSTLLFAETEYWEKKYVVNNEPTEATGSEPPAEKSDPEADLNAQACMLVAQELPGYEIQESFPDTEGEDHRVHKIRTLNNLLKQECAGTMLGKALDLTSQWLNANRPSNFQ